MKSNDTKKPRKQETDWSFDHLLGTLAGAFVLPECSDCADTLECVRACEDVVCIMVTQYSYRTCETLPFLLLRKATLAQPSPMSRRIPFRGDSGEASTLSA